MSVVESYVQGGWHRPDGGARILHAVTGAELATISSAGVDMAAVASYARTVGGPALRDMTFHDRAAMLRSVGKHLLANTEHLYEMSTATGATRADSWIDIEGGAGVRRACAGKGRRELPTAKVWVDGDV